MSDKEPQNEVPPDEPKGSGGAVAPRPSFSPPRPSSVGTPQAPRITLPGITPAPPPPSGPSHAPERAPDPLGRPSGPPPPPIRSRPAAAPDAALGGPPLGSGGESARTPPPPPSMRPPSLRPPVAPIRSSSLPPSSGLGIGSSAAATGPASGGTPQTIPSGSVAISAEARALQLANQLVQARHDLASAQADLRNARSERDSLRAELARARTRIEELEIALAIEEEPDSPRIAAAVPPALDPALEQELKSRIAELEAELAEARRAAAVPQPLSDLKLVKGIGPKIEKLLKKHGVTEVGHIAAWTAEDIETIAHKIGVQASRIKKDDWVGGAKRLSGAS